ncbi:hypothetical protein [Halobacterium sp. CBA1126]|uniref:DUF7522 family protein n=1 Tax=Halobacterium sp. CBA1126 TaxID=2668074 RepID=UPI0012F8B342|nr:hypothetical protein [Halobacterium sp. CBA1126]MUV60346.1 hypothetical protein [Halobacterium sp. CBA1126]
MAERAHRLAEYCRDRLGDGLRAVGFHSDGDVELAYLRDDLKEQYPADRVQQFIESSRTIHRTVDELDATMGDPQASLHMLDEGLIVQFHFPGEDVVFLAMDSGVGRNFTQFVRECLDEMTE